MTVSLFGVLLCGAILLTPPALSSPGGPGLEPQRPPAPPERPPSPPPGQCGGKCDLHANHTDCHDPACNTCRYNVHVGTFCGDACHMPCKVDKDCLPKAVKREEGGGEEGVIDEEDYGSAPPGGYPPTYFHKCAYCRDGLCKHTAPVSPAPTPSCDGLCDSSSCHSGCGCKESFGGRVCTYPTPPGDQEDPTEGQQGVGIAIQE